MKISWIARAVTSTATVTLKHFKKLKLETFLSKKHMQGKILSNTPILLLLINAGVEETGLRITIYRQY